MTRVLYWGAVTGLWAFIGLAGLFGYLAIGLPSPTDLWVAERSPAITLLDATGTEIATRGVYYGDYVGVDELPTYLPQAVLSAEDRRFYRHYGIDPAGLLRALIANATEGRIVQGGSTITQQLAKNLFLSPERTIKRKIQEMMLALWLESIFKKDEILTLYLNRVYFGSGAYGVEAASKQYFGKSARYVSVQQAALLAGLLRAPSRYSPKNNIALAQERSELVLRTMVEAGYLTEHQRKIAVSSPVALVGLAGSNNIQYFVDWIVDQVPDYVGQPETDLVIKTTLHAPFQSLAEKSIETALARDSERLNVSQAALVSIDRHGAVRAMVGGRSYTHSQFNRAVQAQRQPGSSFKPFVYLTALEHGYKPWTSVTDAPISIGKWQPANFSNKYKGAVTLEQGLSQSINTVAVRISERVGRTAVINTATRLGISSPLEPIPSLALGAKEVNLFELTAAYVPIANGGTGIFPYGIQEIKTRGGQVLYERHGGGPGRVIEPSHAGTLARMMSQTLTSGTGRAARLEQRDAGGKTGTSQEFRDAWFVGFTADLITGVWVGNDNSAPMNRVTGGGLPALVWHDYMNLAASSYPARPLPDGTSTDGPDLRVATDSRQKEGGFFERLLARITSGLGPDRASAGTN